MQCGIRVLKRPAVSAIAALAVFSAVLAGSALADPADDALAKLNELSRQAEQTTEAMHSAQLDLTDKVAAQQAAEGNVLFAKLLMFIGFPGHVLPQTDN